MDISVGLYGDLEARARTLLRRRRMPWQPDTCSLVNRACVKLLQGKRTRFESRAEFLSFAATALRTVLIDLARERLTEKRGGGRDDVSLEANDTNLRSEATTVLDVQRTLEKLRTDAPDVARVVDLHYFGGLTWAEVAEVTGKTESDVQKDWYFGRAWFRSQLDDGDELG